MLQVRQAAASSSSQLPAHLLQWPPCMLTPGACAPVEGCYEVWACLCSGAAACRARAQHPCCSDPHLQEQTRFWAARQGTHVACRFLVTYMCAPDGGQPAVITDLTRDWPALERWQDLDYLSRWAERTLGCPDLRI